MSNRLPPSASIASAAAGGKLHAPSAERNADALTELLRRIAPSTGHALEIASGTGQHIARFATTFPGLTWTPSEVAADRLASIDAYRTEAMQANLRPASHLDACTAGWSGHIPAQDLILTINLLHLIAENAARTLIQEAALALSAKGTLMLYGPFLRNGKTTSDGDAQFNADLQRANPDIGYKDRDQVINWATKNGLAHAETVQMPANNLALIFTSP
ncbi:DUF938 domain-containing protein [Tateyamaria sp.]|uniref:DUF938 domain-containing protein n=1 Tax=Tateyamaria sp. TaxID=1929288 RepID=UPI003B20F92A